MSTVSAPLSVRSPGPRPRRAPLRSLCVLAALVVAPSASAAQAAPLSSDHLAGSLAPTTAILRGPHFAVEVNEYGVLTNFPAEGLVTLDGPAAVLLPGTVEWFGLKVETAAADMEAVGIGLAPDWAGRALLEPVSFLADEQEAVATLRFGDLWIESRFRFDPDGPYLLNTITYSNFSGVHIDEVQATREWELPSGETWDWPSKPWKGGPPHGVARMYLEETELSPGQSVSIGFSFAQRTIALGSTPLTVPDVPLVPYTDLDHPNGLDFGETNGISWGDVDGDGWPDVVACQSGHVWRNLAGQGWELVHDLDDWLPHALVRYGTSLADFNRDGLADIATEPRIVEGDACLRILRTEPDGQFTEIGAVPGLVIGLPCDANGETICWADVDTDGDLDLFFPAYPDWVTPGGLGNRLLENLGPVADGGATVFRVKQAGLSNPWLSAKPEGAQFADVDGDGDVDLYCNATLYRNISKVGKPAFEDLDPLAWTVLVNTFIDEGAAFLDYDQDGDLDLAVAFLSGLIGTRLFENRGDGTFAYVDADVVESHLIGLGLGLSVADWDGDGDLDITTRNVFRRNLYAETGEAKFVVASTDIDPAHLTSATPAWADWDRDGDLDCALGNYFDNGRLYENTLYGADTVESERRYLRVRPVSATAPGTGAANSTPVDDQFGAIARLRVHGESDRVRTNFTASGGGYLNQNEYALHFALPADPEPLTPVDDLRVDLAVDFPSEPSLGQPRVDRFVNPVLGGLSPTALLDRELAVYRDGRVRVNGALLAPVPFVNPRLLTTTNGLALPDAQTGLAPPIASGGQERWVGIDFDTLAAASPLWAVELVLDGQLAHPADCFGPGPVPAGPANVVLWELGGGGAVPVWSAALATRATNRRSTLPLATQLEPGRRYRLLARVGAFRASPVQAPVSTGPLRVRGGLRLSQGGCDPLQVAASPVVTTAVFAALRFRMSAAPPWVSLGQSSAGSGGQHPTLQGKGTPSPGKLARLQLVGAAPNAPVTLFFGPAPVCAAIAGQVLVPGLENAQGGLVTNGHGELTVNLTWPADFQLGHTSYLQMMVLDPGAPLGAALSNALVVTTVE